MVLLGIAIAVIYWIFSALSDMVIFGQGSLLEGIFAPNFKEIIHRLSVIIVLILTSIYFRHLAGKRFAVDDELDKEYNLSPLDLNRIGSMAFVFDLTGRILRFNKACEKNTDYSFAEVRNKLFWKLFLERDAAEMTKLRLHWFSSSPFPKEYESVWLAKDRRRIFIKWHSTVVLGKDSKPKYIVSVGADITEYQQKQSIFRGFKRQHQGLIDNIGIGISVISPDLSIAQKNRQLKEWFPEKSISNRSISHDILSNFSSQNCGNCPSCKALSESGIHEAMIEVNSLGKKMVYKVSASAVVDDKGEVVGAIETVQDFTKINQQEEEIRHNCLNQAVINSLLRFSLENITLEGFLKCALSIIISTPWLSLKSKVAIYLADNEPEALILRAQVNLSKEEVNSLNRFAFGQDLVGKAAQSARLQFSAYVYEQDRPQAKIRKAYAHYCLPILYSGAILGVMDVYLEAGYNRNKQKEEFLSAIANTLAGVIHRKEVEERLGKINDCFVKLKMDPVINIQSFVALSGEILEADAVFYQQFDSSTTSFEVISEYNSPNSYRPLIKDYESICHEVIEAKGETLVRNLPKTVQSAKGPKFHTFVGQAIKCGGNCVGLLAGIYRGYFRLKEDDRKFLGVIVSAIGVEEERIKSKRYLDATYDKLKEAQQELVQSEKLAALGRFSSGMAHEVKNPLGIILGGIEFLERKLASKDKDVKLAIRKIKESTLRADSVVRNLLKFAMPSEIKTEKINPEDLINDTLALIKYRVSLINVKIQTDFTKEDIFIAGDKNQLQQVLFNLIINAVEAVTKSSIIKVKTFRVPDDYLAQPACAIEISDTGQGIPEEDLSKLFEPFFTTKRNKKGTGLGLSISKIIVENHKGKLTIHSELEKGTTARIVLPTVNGQG